MGNTDDTLENSTALKNLYNLDYLKRIAKSIALVHPSFKSKPFVDLHNDFHKLEMKARVHLIRDHLADVLPEDFLKANKILQEATEHSQLSGFDLWPFTEFIQTYGLNHPEVSLQALKYFTRLFTSEFAVRPFIIKHPELTFAFLNKCSKDQDPHVRRWASEGTRSRLPWGQRLHSVVADPTHTRTILENLKFDEELYVRKSVANHLNDISKDHPDLAIKILGEWKKKATEKRHEKKHLEKITWITHHALRTLIKKGHPGALKLIGVNGDAQVQLTELNIQKTALKLGDRLDFSFEIKSTSSKPQKLVIDYVLHFMKANNKTSPKVFKLRTLTVAGKEKISLAKSHHIKKITTRVYYPGAHALEIQVNGKILGRSKWKLLRPK